MTNQIPDGDPVDMTQVRLGEPSPEEVVAQYNTWLAKPGNGDAPCTCGHLFRRHFADLNGCGDCDTFEPVHLRCEGFNLDRAGLTSHG